VKDTPITYQQHNKNQAIKVTCSDAYRDPGPDFYLDLNESFPVKITAIGGDYMPAVLIVDDNSELVQLYTLILTKGGYQVFSAGDGEQCFSLLGTMLPDLVLLDIMMEPMDGWEVLTRIRRTGRTAGVPVIMVSGKKPTRGEIQKYIEWVDDYRIKPLTVKGLKGVVDGFMASRDTIDHEVLQSGLGGAGDQVQAEYRGLRRSVTSGTAMVRLLEIPDEEITRQIDAKKKRLKELQEEYGVATSSFIESEKR